MKKIGYIETMRGIACILLVLFHTIGSYSSNGLQLPDDDALRIFNNLLQDLRMPIFSFVSGFVFMFSASTVQEVLAACVKKLRRLYVPMAVASTVLFVLKDLTNGNGQKFITIFYSGYEHLWYLQATLVLMFSHIIIVFLSKINHIRVAFILALIGSIAYILFYDQLTTIMSINGASYLSPYFFVGYIVSHKYKQWSELKRPLNENRRNWVFLATAGIVLLIIQYPLKMHFFLISDIIYNLIRIFIGISVCITFMRFRVFSANLIWLGGKSYSIYLYHTIFAALAREGLLLFFPHANVYLFVIPILVSGLFGPVLVEWIAMRWAFSAFFVLGIKKRSVWQKAPRLDESADFENPRDLPLAGRAD